MKEASKEALAEDRAERGAKGVGISNDKLTRLLEIRD